jgi:hypothetical protein
MSVPKCVTDAIAMLRAERQPLAARLDAMDLAIDNLNRAWGLTASAPVVSERRKVERRKPGRPKLVQPAAAEAVVTDASERRAVLLELIGKAEHGLTFSELCQRTPKMDEAGRRNALTKLREAGQIKRAGNAWVKAA